MLRVAFRFAKLVRIDHILGFERTFWVPMNGLPGTYVKMPKDALLAVARIEAARLDTALAAAVGYYELLAAESALETVAIQQRARRESPGARTEPGVRAPRRAW